MNDPDYAKDREFAESLMPQVKMLLGYYLLTGQYLEEDTERATDLIVLTMQCKRIAVRIRRYKYYLKYPNDFTVRYTKGSGCKTEYEKVVYDDFGDYMFYGFANESGTEIIRWVIIDLAVFREYVRDKDERFVKAHYHENTFNDDTFLAFKVTEIPNCILAYREKSAKKCTKPSWFGRIPMYVLRSKYVI